MLLQNKNAVIYGAGGAVGSAVARAFAREGARVFLAGRTLAKLNEVAAEIKYAGGEAEAAQVDAFDERSVNAHLEEVVAKAGSIDISFNVIGIEPIMGSPLVEMAQEAFALPIVNAMRTQFLTATAAARHMAKSKAGVILALTAQVSRKPSGNMGGFGVAGAAIEGLFRQLAYEAGPQGIRVIILRSAGSPDTPGVRAAMRVHAENAGISIEELEAHNAESTLLKRLPKLAEVADAAVLSASDRAGIITGAIINVTCGEIID